MTGLCFIRLVDFDQDNIEELVLAYNKETEPSPASFGDYVWEVWGYEDGQPVLLASDSLFMAEGNAQSVILTQYEGKWYLVSGSGDSYSYNYYFGFGKDNFGLVREALMVENADTSMSYYISGTPVTAEQWNAEEAAWKANKEMYRMNYVSDATELLAMYNDAKAMLSMETSDTTTAAAPEADYVLPNSSQERLTREMLQGLSADELMIARNEIFARHGRKFNTPEIQQHFDSKSWYVPKYTPEEFEAIQYTELSEIEWANIDLINALEAEAPAEGAAGTAPAAGQTAVLRGSITTRIWAT